MYYNQELESGVNVDYLLLLVNNGKLLELKEFPIKKHFEKERNELKKLCEGDDDNIEEITNFLESLKPKIPDSTIRYCSVLDSAWRNYVSISIDDKIKELLNKRNVIYDYDKKNKQKINKDDFDVQFSIKREFSKIKQEIILINRDEQNIRNIPTWFNALDLEFAYKKVKEIPGVVAFSNKRSFWSHLENNWKEIEYTATENFKIELKTNFGFGSKSYFFVVLKYKGITITSFSEWVDYQQKRFGIVVGEASDIIRYTKSFRRLYKKLYRNGNCYLKADIQDRYWQDALEFIRDAGNLSLVDEKEFIDKYIISECEYMIKGLEIFLNRSEFEFIQEVDMYKDDEEFSHTEINKVKYSFKGDELIDFRAEKILGALDFIDELTEYKNVSINTDDFIKRIYAINESFIPYVEKELEIKKSELEDVIKDYIDFLLPYDEDEFLTAYNELLEKEQFYSKELLKLGTEDFSKKYGRIIDDNGEYFKFKKGFNELKKQINTFNQRRKLREDSIAKLSGYIDKYRCATDKVYKFEKEANEIVFPSFDLCEFPESIDIETIQYSTVDKEQREMVERWTDSLNDLYRRAINMGLPEDKAITFKTAAHMVLCQKEVEGLKKFFGLLIIAYQRSVGNKNKWKRWEYYNDVYRYYFGEDLDKKFVPMPTVIIGDVSEDSNGRYLIIQDKWEKIKINENTFIPASKRIRVRLPLWFLDRERGKEVYGKLVVEYVDFPVEIKNKYDYTIKTLNYIYEFEKV